MFGRILMVWQIIIALNLVVLASPQTHNMHDFHDNPYFLMENSELTGEWDAKKLLDALPIVAAPLPVPKQSSEDYTPAFVVTSYLRLLPIQLFSRPPPATL